jgi:hypothetical protein
MRREDLDTNGSHGCPPAWPIRHSACLESQQRSRGIVWFTSSPPQQILFDWHELKWWNYQVGRQKMYSTPIEAKMEELSIETNMDRRVRNCSKTQEAESTRRLTDQRHLLIIWHGHHITDRSTVQTKTKQKEYSRHIRVALITWARLLTSYLLSIQ